MKSGSKARIRNARNLAGALGGLVLALLAPASCSDSFTTCDVTRTCPLEPEGGAAGQSAANLGGNTEGGASSVVEPSGGSGIIAGSTGSPGASAGQELGGAAPESELGDGGGGGVGTPVAGAPATDSTPPTVLSISPEVGATGVPSDVTIKVTFSEAMNKVSAQAAFQSASLGTVTFDWESDSVMTVKPVLPLPYAEGTTLATPARNYSFTITTAAADASNNTLKKSTTGQFSTLRAVTLIAPIVKEPWSYSEGPGGFVTPPGNPPLGNGVTIGDLPSAGHPVNSVRGLFVYDISSLPTNIVSFVSATLTMSICCTEGNPSSLGAIIVEHLFLSPIDNTYFYMKPLDTPGVLAAAPTQGTKTLLVTPAVEGDYAKRALRNNQVQLRVGFGTEINNDTVSDLVVLDKDGGGRPATQISTTFLIE